MPVTLTLPALAAALRLGDGVVVPPEPLRGTLTANLLAATVILEKHALATCPNAVLNMATIRLAGYWYFQPQASAGVNWANALANSGAAAVLREWRVPPSALIDDVGTTTAATSTPTPTPTTPVTPNGGNPNPAQAGGGGPLTFTDARLYCGWIEPDAVRVFTTQLNAANFAHSSDVAIPAYPNVGAEGILFFAVRDEWGAPPGGVALDGVGQGTNIYTRQDNIIDDSISGEYAIYLFNAAQAVASYGDGDRVLSVLGYPADIEANPTGADPEPEAPPEDTTLTDTDVRYIGWVGDFVLTVTAVEWAAAVRYENGGPLTIPPFPAHLHLHGTPWIAVPRALGDPNPVLRSQNGNPGLSPTFRQMRDERTVGGVIFDLWTADNQYDAHFGDGTWTFTAAV